MSKLPERNAVTVEEVREAMRKLRGILKPDNRETVYMDWHGRCPVCLAKLDRIDETQRDWICPLCGRTGVFSSCSGGKMAEREEEIDGKDPYH